MFRSVLTLTALCGAVAFSPSSRLSFGVARSIIRSTPADEFASDKPPVVAPEAGDADSDEDLAGVDFDSLAKESAEAAFTTVQVKDEYIVSEDAQRAPRQAKWFPMLLSPSSLDGTYAGDVGFDPIGFSKTPEDLKRMREAEVKHARLAMLAAAGWPMSELKHKELADFLDLDDILAAGERAPSVLNGGLGNTWIIGAAIGAIVMGGVLEFAAKQANDADSRRKPGDYGWDPLNLYSFRSSFFLDRITEQVSREEKLARAKFDMELCEIKNGRLAMIGIIGMAAQEFITGMPVVQQTPFFFGDPIF